MANQAIVERIKFNTEVIKLFGLLIIATATGIFSLILSGVNNTTEFLILLVGFIILFLLFGIAIFMYSQTLRLLRDLKNV